MKKYTFGVLIGRFQPPHHAHIQVMQEGLELVETLIVVIGSAKAARNIKNPFTAEERHEMIRRSLLDSGVHQNKILFAHVRDDMYHEDKWLAEVQHKVQELTRGSGDIAILGHEKDESSYYLRSFPEWSFVPTTVRSDLNATDVRKAYFGEGVSEKVEHSVPTGALSFLHSFAQTPEYALLQAEFADIQHYKTLWEKAPFPPVFVTTDAVVIKSGHVLLIKRGMHPGKGTWAMPGGFLDIQETLLQSCIRELYEETKIDVQHLENFVKDQKVFDYPARSLRGRTITHAFLFDLGSGKLPKVEAADDAAEAHWLPIAEAFAQPEAFFEDHYSIMAYFLLKT